MTATSNSTTDMRFDHPDFKPSTYLEQIWYYALKTYGEDKMAFAVYVVLVSLYFSVGFVLWYAEQNRLFPSFRIQKGKWPTPESYWKVFKSLLITYGGLILPLAYFLSPLLTSIGLDYNLPLPSKTVGFIQFSLCVLLEDLGQYFFHRALHHPKLYWIHKRHHENVTPFGLAATYSHPIETAVLGLCTFIGPILLIPHPFLVYFWILFRQMDAVKTHSGYHFWFDPANLIPYYGGAIFHDYHHKAFLFNFASRFTFIDVWFGTYKVPNQKDPVSSKHTFDPVANTSPNKEK